MAIQSVTLTNFRGFRYHTVALNKLSVLVGHNNAGKTTFIDAIRLLAVACEKAQTGNYTRPPDWLRGQTRDPGFSTTFKTVNFDFENTTYNQHQEEPSKIEVRFRNKTTLTLWLEAEGQANFVQVRSATGEPVMSRAQARRCGMTPIYVMPPINRVIPKEELLNPETVRAQSYGRLAYRHFRNQLHIDEESYPAWLDIIQRTWHGLRVESFDAGVGDGGNELSLIVADPPFVSEIAWVGSGLQAWMQIMWFLCRTPRISSIVLDEPDAYLHADLQRKLIKITAEMDFLQLSIATHSTEIISDVDPHSIIVVKKRNRYSIKPAKKERVQSIIDDLGSRHNLQLAKLAEARRVIVYEGDDQKFLSQIALKLGDGIYNSFMLVPYFDIAGVQNWREAVGAAKALAAATADHVSAFLVIDRDYRAVDEIKEIATIAQGAGLKFHCWSRKEIENFFVSHRIIARFVTACGNRLMHHDEAKALIQECADGLVEHCVGVIADQYFSGDRELAERHFQSISDGRQLADVVGGKRLISAISSRLQKSWGCQVSAINLCRFAAEDELDGEIINLVRTFSGR
jgi:predicted ATPase